MCNWQQTPEEAAPLCGTLSSYRGEHTRAFPSLEWRRILILAFEAPISSFYAPVPLRPAQHSLTLTFWFVKTLSTPSTSMRREALKCNPGLYLHFKWISLKQSLLSEKTDWARLCSLCPWSHFALGFVSLLPPSKSIFSLRLRAWLSDSHPAQGREGPFCPKLGRARPLLVIS